MESKVMCMMLEVNIAFHPLYLGDVVHKTCIIARPLSSSSLYSWRSTDGALSAGASIISWRGGDSIIKSASGV